MASISSNYDDENFVSNADERDSEFNNSEYYYNPTDDMNADESTHFEELVQTYMHDVHYTTIVQTGMNLAYSMINVGIVGLPFCAYEAGIPLFVVSVVMFTFLSAYISSLLVEMAEDERVRSLEALSERAFGARGYFLTGVVQLVFSFTIICVTFGEWGNVIPTVVSTNFGDSLPSGIIFDALTDRKCILVVGALLTLPGCFSRTFSTLSWSSFFTLSTIIVTILWSLYVLLRFVEGRDESNGKNILKIRSLWWTTEVIICFCLSFQQKLFFVFNCLRRRSVRRFSPAVKYSHLFVALLYITFGCICALHMKDVTDFRHFNYFKDPEGTTGSRVVFDVTRTVVSFSLLFTVPVECLVIVTVWRRLLRRYNRYLKSNYHQSGGIYSGILSPSGDDVAEDESDDDNNRQAARVNDRMCCLEMSSLFRESATDSGECIEEGDECFGGSHVNTPTTVQTTTNNSIERYRQRVNTFDHSDTSPSSSFKSNTTDDNLKTLSSVLSDSNSSLSGMRPASSPSRRSERTVSFQDESTPPRPLVSSVDNKKTLVTPRMPRRNLNTSIHIAADSPHILPHSDTHTHSYPRPPPVSGPVPVPRRGSLNDSASVISSFRGSSNSVYGEVRCSDVPDEVCLSCRLDNNNIVSLKSCCDTDCEQSAGDRRSSVGDVEALRPSPRERCRASMPILFVWAAALSFSLFVYQSFLYSALFVTALITSIFMFMLPSMLYFRLGVKSDFESIPICGVLPNRLYMYILQFLGILFIVGNFVGLSITLYDNYHGNSIDMHL